MSVIGNDRIVPASHAHYKSTIAVVVQEPVRERGDAVVESITALHTYWATFALPQILLLLRVCE